MKDYITPKKNVFMPWGCIAVLIVFSSFTGYSIATAYYCYLGSSEILSSIFAILFCSTMLIADLYILIRWDKFLNERYKRKLNYLTSFNSKEKQNKQENDITTLKHIDNVIRYMRYIINELSDRADSHDESMLVEPEISAFEELEEAPKYGTQNYTDHLKDISILKHHYMLNRHHPEHFKNGIRDMNLIDIIEMLCDWKSASLNGGDIHKSIQLNQSRFNYGNELKGILENTAKLLYKYSIEYKNLRTGYAVTYVADSVESLYDKIDDDNLTSDIEKYNIRYGPKDEFLEHDYRNLKSYGYKAEYIYSVREFKLGV